MKTQTRHLLPLAMLLAACTAQAQGNFYLKEGDRVVFYGDSITDQRLYTTFAETYVVTRFPKMNVSFVHSGWGGDRVTGGGGGPIDIRLKRDVFAYKPTVMTIMLGMNDASYRPFDQNIFNTYANGYQKIITDVKKELPGIRITVIQPSPFDDVTRNPTFEGGYNAVLLRYSSYVKELAQKENLQVADLNNPVVVALQKAKSLDTSKPANPNDMTLAQRIIPDRVHPGPGGHLLMAEALLKAWNAPALVSRTEISVGSGVQTQAANTSLTGVEWKNGTLRWTQTDEALPMPIDLGDPATALSVKASDVVEALDQQPLKVTGLTANRYMLRIDGQAVGTFSKEELGQGINLAMLPTPMAKQAADVHYLTRLHNDIHFTKWRSVHVPHQDNLTAYYKKTMDALDRADADLVKQQRTAAQPKARRFELKPE